MKKCSKCGLIKKESEFSKNKRKKDGLQCSCKICKRKENRNHYNNNKQYYIEKAKKQQKKIELWVKNIKQNNPCVDCGSYFHFAAMDFDHIDPAFKILEISRLSRRSSFKKVKQEMDKCELVCANCHRVRTFCRKNNILS